MAKNRNTNEGRWSGFWFVVLTGVATHGIDHLFYCLRQNYRFKKAEQERERRRAEEAAEQKKAQCQAGEDLEAQLKQKDRDVRNYVFKVLRLYQTDPPQGERVCADETDGKRYSRPSLIGRLLSKGDTCIIVSQPGVGKSILAFQMGDDIAGGKKSKLVNNAEEQQPPQPVFYWDAEMDSDDMRERYPEGLSSNLVRFSGCTYRDGFYLLKHIYEVLSTMTSDATIVLDNWKALSARMDAFYFMTGLRHLQEMFIERGLRLTVIIVIHTTKEACKKYEVDLGDVAGAAEITRFAKSVLFVNPYCSRLVALHDAKRRRARKNGDSVLVLKGGEGESENLHFESVIEEEAQRLMKELGVCQDNAPKKPGRPQKLSEDEIAEIIEELSEGATIKSLAKKYGVAETTIRNIKNSNRG